MKYYKLPFDDVWVPDKPIEVAYINDKAMNFNNNWGDITEKLISNSRKYK